MTRRRLTSLLSRLLDDTGAVSVVEFGLTAPLIMLIGAGGIELINFILANQKVERIASVTADNVARNSLAPSEQSFADTFTAVNKIARPFDVLKNGRVIMTGVIGVPQNGSVVGKIVWQRCSGLLAGVASSLGKAPSNPDAWAEGPDVKLPNNIQILQNQLVVMSEVAYKYEPIINIDQLVGAPPSGVIRQKSIFVSRGQAFPYVTPSQDITPATCN